MHDPAWNPRLVALGVAILALSASIRAQSSAPTWVSTFGGQPGANRDIFAITPFDDGTGPALYAGGNFTGVGGQMANYIGRWDGRTWSAFGSGMNDEVHALAVFDDGSGPALYAGGGFTVAGGSAANHIARWDGTSWSALGAGTTATVRALEVFDDGSGPALYAGGDFANAGGIQALSVAKWDGTGWAPLGSGLTSGPVRALAVFDDGGGPALYAGGKFDSAGGGGVSNVAKWGGTAWSNLGSGVNDEVQALAVFDDGHCGPALYSGGRFTSAGGLPANFVAKWNGSNWVGPDQPGNLGIGMNNWVLSLGVFDDGSGAGAALYAGGHFTSAGSATANHVAKWNGVSWSPLGAGTSSGVFQAPVHALEVFDDEIGGGPALYAAGQLRFAGKVGANRIARWDGSSWSALGEGISNGVRAMTVFDDGQGTGAALYAGGSFRSAGGFVANHVAKWDGTRWFPLGGGVTGVPSFVGPDVWALTAFDDGSGPALYAAGEISSAGDANTNYIAKWDGTSWSALAGGLNAFTWALTTFDEGSGAGPALYAGGWFTQAGGVPANRVARWDGWSWSPLGSGLDANVNGFTVFDDGRGGGPVLVVVGDFGSAGGVPASRIAQWDGASWSPLGSGLNSGARTLAVFDDGGGPALYAGGWFTNAGGSAAFRIAKWDGSSWSALPGGGTNHNVYALEVFDDGSGTGPALYAAGEFASAGGLPANRIARWDGSNWSVIGSGAANSGMNRWIDALEVFDDGSGPALFAGGFFDFSASGDSFLAKWGRR